MGIHFVASLKAVISDFAGVVNGVPLLLHLNFTVPVGQVKKGLSGPHRELRGNVETEKPHSWLTVAGYVCTNVDFREVGNGIECRAVPQRYAAHVERDDGDPCFAFIQVDIKGAGDLFSEILIVDFPMKES